MNRKLNLILLIDDDESVNFINEAVIRLAGCAERVVTVQSGMAALDYLNAEDEEENIHPDLIFLDINMPAMDGWEFLEAYKNISGFQREKTTVVMLTTSLNPDDERKANNIEEISAFRHKPLTRKTLEEVIEVHFKTLTQ